MILRAHARMWLMAAGFCAVLCLPGEAQTLPGDGPPGTSENRFSSPSPPIANRDASESPTGSNGASDGEHGAAGDSEMPVPVVEQEGTAGPSGAEFDRAEWYDQGYHQQEPAYGPLAPLWHPPSNRISVRGEYLLWWTAGSYVPALLTTSPVGTLPQDSGILGRPGTTVLAGDGDLATACRSGGRFTVECPAAPWTWLSIEANYLFLGNGAYHRQFDSTLIPILARPYVDLGLDAESALLVAHPAFLEGSAWIDATTDVQGAEILLRQLVFGRFSGRVDFLLGYRFSWLDDDLRIRQFSRWTAAQGIILPGTTKDLVDLFDAENQFHGGEIGLAYRERAGRWSLELLGKVALGNTQSHVRVAGSTITTVPNGASATFSGGLLAQPTNIGSYIENRSSVIPEFGVTLGCDVTPRLRATFGYTFIYWSGVMRAGAQIDRDLSQLPPEPPTGENRPAVLMRTSDFWAQGMNFGLDYRF
jgi:hypothetical protein